MAGDRIGPYLLVEKLGEGGMGVVYRAEDEQRGRRVAVKLLRSDWAQDPKAAERFHREARITSKLHHPHVCAVYEYGNHAGCPYMVEELMEGQTLSDMLGGWPLAIARMVDIGIQVADALAAAHASGIIHRDIKSSNIFITEHGVAKVLDFGLAKLSSDAPSVLTSEVAPIAYESAAEPFAGSGSGPAPDSSVSVPGLTVGTATNMSPEQVAGKELDHRSDIFSLGIVLYEMATGVLPFRGIDSATIMQSILCEPYPSPSKLNPNLPPEIDLIISQALQKERNLRYQSMEDLKADLIRVRRQLGLVEVGSDNLDEQDAEGLSNEADTSSAHLAVVEPWDAVARDGRDFLERGSGVLYWFRVPLGGISYPLGFRTGLQPALENRRVSEVRLVLDAAGGEVFSQHVMPLIHGWAKRKKRLLAAHTEAHRGRLYEESTGHTLLSWVFADLSAEYSPSFRLFVDEQRSVSSPRGFDADFATDLGSESGEVEILLGTTVRSVRTSDGSQHNLRVPDIVLRTRTFSHEGLVATLGRMVNRWDFLLPAAAGAGGPRQS